MILVIDNGNGNFVIQHQAEKLGKLEEELKQIGVLLNSVPVPEIIEGKSAVLKFDGTNLYYEYVDIPLTTEEKITVMEKSQAQLNSDLSSFMEYYFSSGGV